MDSIQGIKNCAISLVNVKLHEQVLIVTDTKSDMNVTLGLAAVCREAGADVSVTIMEARSMPHEEPPRPVAEAVKAADVVFLPLTEAITYSPSVKKARELGTRTIVVSPVLDSYCEPGARFPLEIVFRVCEKVFNQWRHGKVMRITSDKGTDLTTELRPQNVVGGPMKPVEPGTFEVFAGGTGDVGLWPAWTSNGVVYFDHVETFPYALSTPLKAEIKKGRATKFQGDPTQVKFFEDMRAKFGDDAWHLGEIMIGLNPFAKIRLDVPEPLEAQRHAGVMHMAFGQSIDFYDDPTDRKTMRNPSVNPGVHTDHTLVDANMFIDDEPCIEKGKLLVLHDPEIQKLAKKYDLKF
jgi:leucyl aminopeptidase (aminopeptidase T)